MHVLCGPRPLSSATVIHRYRHPGRRRLRESENSCAEVVLLEDLFLDASRVLHAHDGRDWSNAGPDTLNVSALRAATSCCNMNSEWPRAGARHVSLSVQCDRDWRHDGRLVGCTDHVDIVIVFAALTGIVYKVPPTSPPADDARAQRGPYPLGDAEI